MIIIVIVIIMMIVIIIIKYMWHSKKHVTNLSKKLEDKKIDNDMLME